MNKHPRLIVRSEFPYNAEPPLDLLRGHYVTPRELFYVRNHGSIPEIDPARYRLVVDGLVDRPLELSLDRLMNDFPKRTVMASVQCAGNRRDQLIAVAPIVGEVPWAAGAIGNAFWSGVALRELLNAVNVQVGAQYAAFLGADEVVRDGESMSFGSSIPLDKALSAEVLLAYEMNGQPLEPEHGYPLRVIVPGYIGARSVKWLARITVQAAPSQNYFQTHAYQLFPPQMTLETVDWSAGLQLGEMGVNAVICTPQPGALLPGQVGVRGYALSSGRRRIARVDASGDDGKTWSTAQLIQGDTPWAWTFWEARLNLAPGDHMLVVRAFDTAANTQPEDPRHIWNFKGYVNNAWHRVPIRVETS